MSLTPNDLYLTAAKGETSWEHALLLTGLLYMGTEGFVISPPPIDEHEWDFYKLRFEALIKYPNNDDSYKDVTDTLHNYIIMATY